MRWFSLIAITAALIYSVLMLRGNEDISEFLPLSDDDRNALSVYQNISGANRVVILFDGTDADSLVEAIDQFEEEVHAHDSLGYCAELTTQFDLEGISQLTEFVYEHAPYFLTEQDYARMDSLLSDPAYPATQLARTRDQLMLPSGGMLMEVVQHDPLALFAPVATELRSTHPQMAFELYDGHIFTPDMTRAIAFLTSPFGNSETSHNKQIIEILDRAIQTVQKEYPTVQAHLTGGPIIAVGNAERIKQDSILAIGLSALLIVLLLVFSFQSVRNILLILLSISWGWLFALGMMAVFRDGISIIVLGISSVILGIAINYPLHLIAHTQHQPDMKQAIREIAMPLIVGNITTIGAFMALVPLEAKALRDLGLFASLLLAGTIIFVLFYLPPMVRIQSAPRGRVSGLLSSLSNFQPERHSSIVIVSLLLTVVLGVMSFGVRFDSNISNINYMTDQQRADLEYFSHLMARDTSGVQQSMTSVYLLSEGKDMDEALEANFQKHDSVARLVQSGLVSSHRSISRFVVPKSEQQRRLQRWNSFVDSHSDVLQTIPQWGVEAGFTPAAFAPFMDLLSQSHEFQAQDMDYFSPLTSTLFTNNFTTFNGKSYVVETMDVDHRHVEQVEALMPQSFDVVTMNSAMARTLSDNFNYIGWACSLIVFLFLWLSFRRIELAIISFLPMAVSWLWILGLMSLFNIQFNIVNIILATFIFGQGDDYTIFITEGCQYEYTHNRPILASHKSSILQSALIMFIGIGTLITAQHPAMRSLAEVTIVGMLCVVFMAYLIPPLLFRWLTTKNGVPRQHPITLLSLLTGRKASPEYYRIR